MPNPDSARFIDDFIDSVYNRLQLVRMNLVSAAFDNSPLAAGGFNRQTTLIGESDVPERVLCF